MKRLSYQEACGLRHEAFNERLERLYAMNLDEELVRSGVLTEERMTSCNDPDMLPMENCEMKKVGLVVWNLI